MPTASPSSASFLSPQSIMTNPAANDAARAILLQNALRQSIALAPQTGLNGGQTGIFRLQNYGILTSIDLLVTMTVTNNAASGGAALAPTQNYPYDLLSLIDLKDYAQVHRVHGSGMQIWRRNAVHGARVPYTVPTYAQGGIGAAQFAYPTSVANASIAAASSGTVQFYLRVPVSVGDLNLTGAMLMQAVTGESYLSISIAPNSATGSFDAPFVGDYSISNVQITPTQSFLQPQNDANGQPPPLPLADFATIYELAGDQTSNTDFAVNQNKFINFPDARIVHGMYLEFANGAYNYGNDLTSLEIVASGNNYLLRDPIDVWLMKLRETVGGDLGAGFYYYNCSRVPVKTDLLGQVQMALKPASLGANPYTRLMTESTYSVGMPLPGLGG